MVFPSWIPFVEEVVRQIFAQFREVSRKKLLESVKTNDRHPHPEEVKKIQKVLGKRRQKERGRPETPKHPYVSPA